MANSSAQALSVIVSCFARLRALVMRNDRGGFCDESLIFLDDILQRLDVWASDVRGSENLEDVLAWACQIDHTANVLYVLASSLNRAMEAVEELRGSDSQNETEQRDLVLPVEMRRNLEHAAKDLAVYVSPLRASRIFIPANERTTSRASQINDDDLARAILSEEGRNPELAAISFPAFSQSELQRFLGVAIEKSACLRALFPHDTSEMEITSETQTYRSLLLQSMWAETFQTKDDSPGYSRHVHDPLYITTYRLHPTELNIREAVAQYAQTATSPSSDLYMITWMKVLHHREPATRQHILAVRVAIIENYRHTLLKGWILHKNLNNISRAAEYDFIGRVTLMEDLRQAMVPDEPQSVLENPQERRIFVLHGEQGMGKTQIALKFAELYRYRQARPSLLRMRFWGIFWVDGTTTMTIERSSTEIATLIGFKEQRLTAFAWLGSQDGWLMIIDNANIPVAQLLADYLPPGTSGCILVTTRDTEYRSTTQIRPVGVCQLGGLKPEECITLLLRKGQRNIADHRLRDIAEPIARYLGYSPWEIDVTGASLRDYPGTIDEFVDTRSIVGTRSSTVGTRLSTVGTRSIAGTGLSTPGTRSTAGSRSIASTRLSTPGTRSIAGTRLSIAGTPIMLDDVIYEPVSSLTGSRQQRSQVSMYNDSVHRHMEPYTYKPLRSISRRLRLLRLHAGGLLNPEITCELFEVEYDKDEYNTVRRVLSRDERAARRARLERRRTTWDRWNDGQDPDFDGDVVEYEALSWCWGQEVKDRAIRILEGGKYYRLAVARDLTLALKYLRQPHEVRTLWIDALCINQEDYEERNHQVQMMSLIYSGAKQACIWLGEDNDDSTAAIGFIHEIMKLENFDTISERKENASKWQSLLLLMQRPWFSRRWVIQEIALARSATIYCGDDKISWTNFAVAVELFVEVESATHRLSEVMRKDEKFGHVPQWAEHVSELGASVLVQATGKVFRRDGNQVTDLGEDLDTKPRSRAREAARKSLKRNETKNLDGPPQPSALAPQRPLLSLEYLVSSLSVFQATQPRDAVYSLLAISRDTAPFAELRTKSRAGSDEAIIMSTVSSFLERKPFRVDYSRAYSDVCKDFISFCIQISGRSDSTRALDILCRPWAPEPEAIAGGVVHRKPTLYKFLPTRDRGQLWPAGKARRSTFRVLAEYHSSDIIVTRIEKPEERIGAPMLRQSDTRDIVSYWKDCEDDWRNNFDGRVQSFERDVKPFLPKKKERRKTAEEVGEQGISGVGEQSESEEERERNEDEEQNEQDEDISLPSWISRISGASFALYRHPGMYKLGRIGRMNADPLVGLPQDGHKNYNAAQNTKADYDSDRRLRFRKRPKLDHCSLFTGGFILAKIEEVAEPARLGAIPETWTKVAGWENAIDGQTDPPAEFWRTLVADRGKDGRNPPYYYATACKESVRKGGLRSGSVDTGALINNERNSIIAEFCRRVQAVIWNRCLIKTDKPLNVLGLASQHVRKGDLVCIIFGCTVPVILRKSNKERGDLEKEKIQDQIESMKSAMAVCEEACFRKLRYQKRLEREGKTSEFARNLWKEEVQAELKEVNLQMKKWREREEGGRKRKEAEDKEQEIRRKNRKRSSDNRQSIAKMEKASTTSKSLQLKKRVSMPHFMPPPTDGQERENTTRETKSHQETPEQLKKERQRRKEEAKEEDPKVYYQFIGEAYIHGMMDGEAVRRHFNEGLPRRMFEIR